LESNREPADAKTINS